jgi:Ser/Thr protein kinase RdoA (MazF antagonist)
MDTMDEQREPLRPGAFDLLGPQAVIAAVEGVLETSLDGTVDPYNSYVNRVYGLRGDNGDHLVAKFYRPGRWSEEMILEEHAFLDELATAEVPVVAPISDPDGETLFEIELESSDEPVTIPFAVFPRKGGRTFDAESDEDWFRLGAVVGRMHAVGRRTDATHRLVLEPDWTRSYLDLLVSERVIHPEFEDEFVGLCRETIDRLAPSLEGVPRQRIHGDCHRGNILDRPGEGLMLIDFDDMLQGPAVQDLWLLLPGRVADCGRQLTMLLEGYEEFLPFDRSELDLIEALRVMRMIHFLAWRTVQRHDNWFRRQEPEWGNRAFWIRELEDLRDQIAAT